MVSLLASGHAMSAEYLADFHKGLDIQCKDCHESGIKNISDTQIEQDIACTSCHGDLHEISEKELETKDLSVHHNHLVDIGCTSCHSGHEEPVMACITCHDGFVEKFSMPFLNGKLSPANKFPKISASEIDVAIKAGPVETHELIVIGAGSTGYSSAIQARQAGIKDIVIYEKQPFIGGNSQLSAGGYAAAETIVEAKLGFDDSIELMIDDTMKGGHGINDPKLVRTLAENSAEGIDWLMALGADMTTARRNGGHSADRLHRPSGGKKNGPELIGTLQDNAEQLGVKVETNNKVLKIVMSKSGNIAGVVVQGKHSGVRFIKSDAVVLATGGFGWNNELVAKYRPDLKGTPSTNSPGNTGDGIGLAAGVGAKFIDLKEIQTFPTAGDGRLVISGTARGAGAILLNHDGERFCDELLSRDKVSDAIWAQKDKRAWLIWDDAVMEELGQLKGLLPLNMLTVVSNWDDFQKVGLDPKTVKHEIKLYNTFQQEGKDKEFGRKFMARSLRFPMYLADTAPAIHHTMGGVAITPAAQVRDENDRPIPGLFAGGEVTGGVHGANRLGGNAIGETVVFGRLAGESAAYYIKKLNN